MKDDGEREEGYGGSKKKEEQRRRGWMEREAEMDQVRGEKVRERRERLEGERWRVMQSEGEMVKRTCVGDVSLTSLHVFT